MRIPPSPPPYDPNWFRGLAPEAAGAVANAVNRANEESYAHWDKVRHWTIEGIAPERLWSAIRRSRMFGKETVPFDDVKGGDFSFIRTNAIQRALHEIDSRGRGTIGVSSSALDADGRAAYLQRSLIEEPFSSSVLEGAATTRAVARRMIEESRAPKTVGERMVLNNHRAMEYMRDHRDGDLTVERILEVHRILTEGTLERPEKCGVFRDADDEVTVIDSDGDVVHVPPPAAHLGVRMEKLCAFANAGKEGRFLHPVLRAIILHFMLAYDHPFWDGNGRTARALFYWCVLRHGYWLLEYVAISAAIMKAPKQYGMAFLHTETDGGDLTYFLVHQLGIIEQAMADLSAYLDRKAGALKTLEAVMASAEGAFNRRQLQIIQDSVENPGAAYEIAAHRRLHNVSYLTARADLEGLAERGFLKKGKRGATSVFTVPKNLPDLVKR